MNEEIDILLTTIHNRSVACVLDEVVKVINDVSGIAMNKGIGDEQKTPVYSLNDVLGIPAEEISQDTEDAALLLVKNDLDEYLCISIPGGIDIKTIETSRIMVVPDYLRRKQNPFVVWGYIKDDDKIHTLITFSHLHELSRQDTQSTSSVL